MHITTLYHEPVPLQHERPSSRRLAIALEPPGNVARELSLYRRRAFSALGDASALAFPDLAFLAWGFSLDRPSASLRSPGRCNISLQACWRDVEGPFASSRPVVRRSLVYLELEGSVGALASNAAAALASLGCAPDAAPPLDPGLGFFLYGLGDHLAAPLRAGPPDPPRISFMDCSLVLLRVDIGSDPFRAASWKTLARSRRRTGP